MRFKCACCARGGANLTVKHFCEASDQGAKSELEEEAVSNLQRMAGDVWSEMRSHAVCYH